MAAQLRAMRMQRAAAQKGDVLGALLQAELSTENDDFNLLLPDACGDTFIGRPEMDRVWVQIRGRNL